MLIDLTLQITPELRKSAEGSEERALLGHLGTHFDAMRVAFPLEYTECKGIVFDVRGIVERDIEVSDIAFERVQAGMFVAFYSGFIAEEGYGTKRYFAEHPTLSNALLEALIEKGIAIIGLDFAGVRRGAEHPPMDQHCADHGVFVVENLINLQAILDSGNDQFIARTFPVNYTDMDGLPCRVVAEVQG